MNDVGHTQKVVHILEAGMILDSNCYPKADARNFVERTQVNLFSFLLLFI